MNFGFLSNANMQPVRDSRLFSPLGGFGDTRDDADYRPQAAARPGSGGA